MVTWTHKLVTLKAANGRPIRRASSVRADWGTGCSVVTFVDRMSAHEAIRQAKEMHLRDGTLSPAACR